MKNPNWQPVKIHKDSEFTYVLSFEDEFNCPEYHYIADCGWSSEEFDSIKGMYWFCAKVTAYKGSVECGNDYLGCCTYRTKKEVLQDGNLCNILGGYGPQMVEAAREEALNNLNSED